MTAVAGADPDKCRKIIVWGQILSSAGFCWDEGNNRIILKDFTSLQLEMIGLDWIGSIADLINHHSKDNFD